MISIARKLGLPLLLVICLFAVVQMALGALPASAAPSFDEGPGVGEVVTVTTTIKSSNTQVLVGGTATTTQTISIDEFSDGGIKTIVQTIRVENVATEVVTRTSVTSQTVTNLTTLTGTTVMTRTETSSYEESFTPVLTGTVALTPTAEITPIKSVAQVKVTFFNFAEAPEVLGGYSADLEKCRQEPAMYALVVKGNGPVSIEGPDGLTFTGRPCNATTVADHYSGDGKFANPDGFSVIRHNAPVIKVNGNEISYPNTGEWALVTW